MGLMGVDRLRDGQHVECDNHAMPCHAVCACLCGFVFFLYFLILFVVVWDQRFQTLSERPKEVNHVKSGSARSCSILQPVQSRVGRDRWASDV